MHFLHLLGAPSFSVPTIALPLALYVLFGVLLAPAHPQPEVTMLLPLARWSLLFVLALLGVIPFSAMYPLWS